MTTWINSLKNAMGGKDTEDTKTNPNASTKIPAPPQKSVYADADGELWRFHRRMEQFKLVAREVKAQIVQESDKSCDSYLYILNKAGNVLMVEQLRNDLRIQYNKNDKSMIFTIYDNEKGVVNILSFVFLNQRVEHDFKMAVAIKLIETNRQQSFEKMMKSENLKEEDKEWVQQGYEIAPEKEDSHDPEDDLILDEDVVMQDCRQIVGSNRRSNDNDNENDDEDNEESDEENEERNKNKWDNDTPLKVPENQSDALNTIQQPLFDDNKNDFVNKHITGSKVVNRTYVVRDTNKGSYLGFYKHNDEDQLQYQGKLLLKDSEKQQFTPYKLMQHDCDQKMIFLTEENPTEMSIMDLEKGVVVQQFVMHSSYFFVFLVFSFFFFFFKFFFGNTQKYMFLF